MADGVAITAGAGTLVATDDLTGDGAIGGHVQLVKLIDGADGGNVRAPVTTNKGLAVEPRLKVVRLAVTPTVSTSPAYTAKDAVGGLMTFANAARVSGGSIRLDAVQIVDKAQQQKDLELVLFDRTLTAPTDNSVFAPTDSELATLVAAIPIPAGFYSDYSSNSVADVPVGRSIVLNGTDLFGVLVARGTPTFVATTDIVVTLTISQD